jgi:hypothetical protein
MTEWQLIDENVPRNTKILVYGVWVGEISDSDDQPEIWLCTTKDGKTFNVEGGDYYSVEVVNATLWALITPPDK